MKASITIIICIILSYIPRAEASPVYGAMDVRIVSGALSYSRIPGKEDAFGAEATFTRPFLSKNYYVSLSTDYQYLRSDSFKSHLLRAEFTQYLFVSLGAGAGYRAGDKNGFTWNLFAGLPLPINVFTVIRGKGHHIYTIEPYYRRVWFRNEWSNEFGLYFRYSHEYMTYDLF